MRTRSVLTSALMVVLALVLSVLGPLGAGAQEPLPVPAVGAAPHGKTYISPRVIRAMRAAATSDERVASSVRVIVSFQTAKGLNAAGLSTEDVSTAAAQVLSALPAGSYELVASFKRIPALSLKVNQVGLDALARQPLVYAINLDSEIRTEMDEALPISGAPTVHGFGITGDGVRVGVIDTGIDTDHPGLSDDLFFQRCFLEEDPLMGTCVGGVTSAEDQDGHGSHVSGIITGANGVAPDAQIAALKVFSTGSTSDTVILAALDYAIDEDATLDLDLVNMSLGGDNFSDQASCDLESTAYVTAFASLNALGITVFVATGNDGQIDEIGSPGCATGAVGVGSTGDAAFGSLSFSSCTDIGALDKVSCFSNATPVQGSGELVDLVAPGCLIESEVPGGGTDEFCGTSMATPYTAGVAALLVEFLSDESIPMTPAQIEAHLETSGVQISDYRMPGSAPTFPRVSAVNAIGMLSIDAPTGFNITGNTTTTVDTTWTAVTGAVAYNVYRFADGSLAHTLAGSTVHPDVTFTDTNAACGLLTYYVKAFDGTYESLPSDTDTVTARACPLAPTNLTLTMPTDDTVQLNWTDNASDETAYVVEHQVNGGGFTVLSVLGANVTTEDDGPLVCGYYEYRVQSQRGADKSAYSNVVAAAVCAPDNDLFANAEAVAAVIGSPVTDVEPNIAFASESSEDPIQGCRFGGGTGFQTVWYELTPVVTTKATITTTGTTAGYPDTTLSVYTHNGSDFTEVACNDDIDAFGDNYLSSVLTKLSAGTTYYVMVSQWEDLALTDTGNLTVNFTFAVDDSPPHDEYENARVINTSPYTDTVVGAQTATTQGADPAHSETCAWGGVARVGSHNVWYSFTPAADGQLDVNTETSTGSFTDTIVSVYSGTYGSFTEEACDDDSGTGNLSLIEDVPVTGGTTYTIYVSRWSSTATSSVGTLVLNFAFAADPVVDVELLDNGDFEDDADTNKVPDDWSLKHGLTSDKLVCDPTKVNTGSCAFKFKGGLGEKTTLQQNVNLTGVAFLITDDLEFTVAWNAKKADAVFKPSVVIKFSDATPAVKLSDTLGQTTGYEVATMTQTGLPSAAVSSIKVKLKHSSPSGKVYADSVSLVQTTMTTRSETRAGDVLPPPAAPAGMRGSN